MLSQCVIHGRHHFGGDRRLRREEIKRAGGGPIICRPTGQHERKRVRSTATRVKMGQTTP